MDQKITISGHVQVGDRVSKSGLGGIEFCRESHGTVIASEVFYTVSWDGDNPVTEKVHAADLEKIDTHG